jgi:hypothetical protein
MRLGRTMDQTAFENRRFHISSWMYDSRRRACLRRPPAYRPQCWWGLGPGESSCPGEMPGWCGRTSSTKIKAALERFLAHLGEMFSCIHA